MKAWVINGSADTHDRVQRLLRGLVISPAASEVELEREWRCWREDGSYYGPCSEEQKAEWATIFCEHGFNKVHKLNDASPPKRCYAGGGWNHRHQACGWQLYVMELCIEGDSIG